MSEDLNRSDASCRARREVLKLLATAGIGTLAFQRAVAQEASRFELTLEDVRNAEWVAGIELTEEQRKEVFESIHTLQHQQEQLRSHKIGYDVLPALRFDPEMYQATPAPREGGQPAHLAAASPQKMSVGDAPESLSFLTIAQLGHLLRIGSVTAVQLAQHCLGRLRAVDPTLTCVVTYTDELALRQAEKADAELAAGQDRGPLHGIPWAAKDLIAVAGYPTTWGAPQFRNQILPETATVAKKLEAAGAVLIAKLSLGALAMGDRWFGGQTKNPWNPEEGSSGSSAGSASAVAAGALPFAIGSETLGSIVSPCKRCGVTGLRPTFGRVSRHGCMTLSWSMDKLGPIARSIDDCGIVLSTIHGVDPSDPTTVDRWFEWPMQVDLSSVKIGVVSDAHTSKADQRLLTTLEQLGAALIPISLPRDFSEWAIALMLDAEAATVFHPLLKDDNTDGLNQWPNTFRKLHFLSAVDYLHAARLRSQLMRAMQAVFETVDVFVGGGDLGICNLTGHPTVVLPAMMSGEPHPQPLCGTLTGRLHDEATLLAVASVIESHIAINTKQPKNL